jgi:hypothetical protein
MSANELRLDYQDLVAGQLVIVIHGLPAPDHDANALGNGDLPNASLADPRHVRSHRSPSSPLLD